MVGDAVKRMTGLEDIELRLAKWGYRNNLITDQSLIYLGDALSEIKGLIKIARS